MNKRYLRFMMFFGLLAALLMIFSTVGAAQKDVPVVSLSSDQNEYTASQDVLINFTITNPTKHTLRILKWFIPSEGVEEPIFNVKVDGVSADYTGAFYKRPAVTGNDYISLKSGESVTYVVNLGDYYDLSQSGQYVIYFDVASFNLYNEKGNNATNPDSITSEPLSLKIEGREPKGKPTPVPTPPPGGTVFSRCSATQQTILLAARNQAKNYAIDGGTYLNANLTNSRYVTWFGAVDSSRYATVTTHFANLTDAWTNYGVTFDCGCKQNYYAYVYPNKPYTIYLCRVFWTAPLSGTDSQGGTLIHEMSHFPSVAGTDDFVYGQTGAMSLAVSNPADAVMNADNHEYFAENNPIQP